MNWIRGDRRAIDADESGARVCVCGERRELWAHGARAAPLPNWLARPTRAAEAREQARRRRPQRPGLPARAETGERAPGAARQPAQAAS